MVEYYAYGLTQARRSFFASQLFSAFGAGILLFGIGLAIWRAETSGDMYAGIVTSSAWVVATIIGQFFHRRADLARHCRRRSSGTSLVFKLQSAVATSYTSEIEVLQRPVESTQCATVTKSGSQ
ncbi:MULTISPECIES: TRADD-N-associated membrane domain-containing protein [Streptomyces]|uniref:TRADD-N-associated membrane domain-containing protein n=1 Tax=Streptomyces TaxID=1883 RepID=UPI0035586AD9